MNRWIIFHNWRGGLFKNEKLYKLDGDMIIAEHNNKVLLSRLTVYESDPKYTIYDLSQALIDLSLIQI